MDCSKVLNLLNDLDDQLDGLEESLNPLLQAPLSVTASKLPLLDKAKLYVLITYAIESMLFSYLRLKSINAREHPVFNELARVRQYFEKLKQAESPPAQRNLTVDKGAAGRFIKAGLAGNDKFDLQKAEQQAKERAKAHIRFNDVQNSGNKRQGDNSESSDHLSSSNHKLSTETEAVTTAHRKLNGSPNNSSETGLQNLDNTSSPNPLNHHSSTNNKKSKRKNPGEKKVKSEKTSKKHKSKH